MISQGPKRAEWGAETAEIDVRPARDCAGCHHVLVDEDAGPLDTRPTAVGFGRPCRDTDCRTGAGGDLGNL